MDAVEAELVALQAQWRTPSFMVGERGVTPDGMPQDDAARCERLYRPHVARAFNLGAAPTSAPPSPYVRRSTRAKQPPAEPQAPLWRRGARPTESD